MFCEASILQREALQTVGHILELATLLVFPVTWILPGPWDD